MAAPDLEIDTLIDELQRAKAEGAKFVLLQVNRAGRATFCVPEFAFHDPNIIGAYVIGGQVGAAA